MAGTESTLKLGPKCKKQQLQRQQLHQKASTAVRAICSSKLMAVYVARIPLLALMPIYNNSLPLKSLTFIKIRQPTRYRRKFVV